MTLTATTGTYINPRTFGEYPDATITYVGERHMSKINKFIFRFDLLNKDDIVIDSINWGFNGITASGNTIQNHGELVISGETTDFVTYVMGGGDLENPDMTVITFPSLSYEDIDNYFILGNKKDKVKLPTNVKAKRLVKWMLLNTVKLNNQSLGTQFSF